MERMELERQVAADIARSEAESLCRALCRCDELDMNPVLVIESLDGTWTKVFPDFLKEMRVELKRSVEY